MHRKTIWRGRAGDVDLAVSAARRAAPVWARQPLAARTEYLLRFRQAVEARRESFATLIARETGKPLWECRSEIASVVAKVDISIQAQAERAGVRESVAGETLQVLRHKPHGVLAVLGSAIQAKSSLVFCAFSILRLIESLILVPHSTALLRVALDPRGTAGKSDPLQPSHWGASLRSI